MASFGFDPRRLHLSQFKMRDNAAAKSKEWPKTIRHGNAAVKLYKFKSAEYTLYTLSMAGTGWETQAGAVCGRKKGQG